MCIAIVKPQGTYISDEYLENCFNNNSDGAGIAYAKDGKLFIIKGIFDKEQFVKTVRHVEKIAQGDILIHCRIATSGLKDNNNCHPHIINDSLALIHNGILDIRVPFNSKISDTVIFIDEYLKTLDKNFIADEKIMKLIEYAIGENNKFAFLNNKGVSAICNKKAGVVEGGIWYSNETYRYSGGSYFYDDSELYENIIDKISILNCDEYVALGEAPLVDLLEEKLIPFSKKKLKKINRYIPLEEYSYMLYDEYLANYGTAKFYLEHNEESEEQCALVG